MTRAEIVERLDGTGLPFAPIGKPEELFDDPHLLQGGLEPVTLQDGVQTSLPTVPLEMGGARPGAPQTLKGAGANTEEILRSLGYSKEEMVSIMAGQ